MVDPDLPVFLVDDVVGEGRTIARQSERLRSFGLKVIGRICIASCKRDGAVRLQAGRV